MHSVSKYPLQPDASALFEAWQRESLDILKNWSKELDEFFSCRGDDLSRKEGSGVAILRIQSHIGFISLRLKRTLDDDQTLWDGFCPMFDEIVNLAAEVVQHEAGVP